MLAAIRSFFRNSPVDLRGGLTSGWEYSNERANQPDQQNTSTSSFFTAPVIAAFYDREMGPWTVSLRYSAGYVYYFDPDYSPNGERPEIPSQTAGIDLALERARLRLRSNSTGSYGSGFDIEREQQTERLSVAENFSADYQFGEYVRAGLAATGAYDRYAGQSDDFDDVRSRVAASLYGDYFLTGKTRLRLELGAGNETQDTGAQTALERTFYQVLFRVNYEASEKLTIDAGLGLALQNETAPDGVTDDGLRLIYQLAVVYNPTEKTGVRLSIGREATAVAPNLSLVGVWRPRDTTAVELSVYQQASLSTLASAQDRIARGALASVQQRFFQRIGAGISGGIEKEEYKSVGSREALPSADPYYFLAMTLAWEINRWLALQGQWQTSSRRDFGSTADTRLRTRASVSFRLTF